MCSIAVPTSRRLSVAMKEGSAAEHDAAEQSPFMSELLAGRIGAEGYSDYLLRLRVVYAALEDAVRARRDDSMVAAVYDPALERLTAIDADLDHWLPWGAAREVDSPAAAAYVERLGALTWGGALVAHHYTRYLGDLSGGRGIGKILDRAFDLHGAGLAFYEFPVRPKPYKDAYRARLDALRPDAGEIDRIVGEVKYAFALNQAIFDELADNIADHQR
ncbi:putative heme oxygenase [Mycobacterium mantenii]|uniref:heme oxygenase (biliverdin-producing) n=1 Tax=Mycobacterium mantenii TaxID=560555 RepID=A0A1X0G5D4_MYCNT|nr:biliverdin-producing heme oxygenase [Mycobacterium mantenii]MCV7242105.1 biliverdin-producing heme oxygenase [Mycobacterium mantenii]ORB09214.1 biliverdin-producing heme oxygenase [Mycobacterium mantenii]BBY37223.1 putative heme oxygenase [Mycobacterium mantenii]